jgi:hypothetical protein
MRKTKQRSFVRCSTVETRTSVLAVALALTSGAAVSACKEKPPSETTERTSSESVPPSSAHAVPSAGPPAAAPAPATPKAPELDEASVRAVLDAWLRSQNSGNFSDYERLYAPRFTGVKRAGARTQRFDREAWLKDRRAMFESNFVVKADDVAVNVAGGTGIVTFTQSWTSPRFQDVGKKRLVVVREGKDARIASEEMLTSTQGAGEKKGEPPTAREFAFVKMADGTPLVILEQGVDLNAVGAAPPRYLSNEEAVRDMATKALPERIRELEGTRFDLFDGSGKRCEATVTGFAALVRAVPHFGLVNVWEGRDGHPGNVPPAERAITLWQLSESGGRFLTAKLKPSGPCGSPVWARRHEDGPLPKLWTTRAPNDEERSAALAVARATEPYKALQLDSQRSNGTSTPWDELGLADDFKVFEDGGGKQYLSMTLRGGEEDCGAVFQGELWMLLAKRGGTYQVVSGSSDERTPPPWPVFMGPPQPEFAVDLDEDGFPELYGNDEFFRQSGSVYRPVYNVTPAFFDCPC